MLNARPAPDPHIVVDVTCSALTFAFMSVFFRNGMSPITALLEIDVCIFLRNNSFMAGPSAVQFEARP
jgi:hypothetical protein